MKFQVDRKTWLRGEGGSKSSLFRASDRKQCCLGFLAQATGATESQIVDRKTLREASRVLFAPGLLCSLVREDHDLQTDSSPFGKAMYLNDHVDLDPKVREWGIQQALAPLGLEVEFTG